MSEESLSQPLTTEFPAFNKWFTNPNSQPPIYGAFCCQIADEHLVHMV